MSDLFDLVNYWEVETDKVQSFLNEDKKHIKEKKIYRRFLEKQYAKISEIDDLAGCLPLDSEQIRIITQKSFNAFAILLYILKIKKIIDECYLITYNIDRNTIIGLKELVGNGHIKKLTIVVSSALKNRKPARTQELKNIANKKISVIFVNNHTKIILAKIKNDYYVIEGSGNVTANARIEQYLFENCRDTYNFHKDWIDNIKNSNFNEVKIYNEN